MARVVNKSSRSYIIGGVTLLPHRPEDIDDKYMKNQRVIELMTEGNLELCTPETNENSRVRHLEEKESAE